MAQVVLPSWYGLSSGSGSTAYWLPAANRLMPKLPQVERDRRRIERLEKSLVIISAKIDLLETARGKTEAEISQLREKLS